MFAAERQSRIIEILKEKGSVQVDELAELMQVSPMTIRRDLVKLQNDGHVERCHGGAIAREETAYADKRTSHKQEKKKLAALCKQFVAPGDTIFLDAGTTTLEIAKQIKDIENIMVVTTDIEISRYLIQSDVDLMLCGGMVQKSTGSVLGPYATQMIMDFKFDIGFFGAAIISGTGEVMTPTVEKAFLKRETVKRCEKSYLVVDESKFQKQGMIKINELKDFSAIITNYPFQDEKGEVRIISP
ncbi:DeoR family fructose operon transcriptional repressor [Aequitasia blattaphilus]|uniref:DeoR/GlpR family DNA-binding transcription regulator n=1 Tax=Aequitasia blattaphilus TaxID=2949332 RepID=A0ABT1ED43_9FIRM|nr:DeoR/GlpR family DNA-binding transcription regulator [Aequitasia blattaphilus]MCP1103750.1 DeoR/GlpR family DNA-binding transcription regulator [Aequitasia blattaphilus]MCR8616390.1 DeoR/GlpR family DNA-binding transcription regulator [Aequitasia blattaphilus]